MNSEVSDFRKMAGVICCPKKIGDESEEVEEMLPETGL